MPPPSEISHSTQRDEKPEYNPDERELLLRLAHAAVISALEGRDLDPLFSSAQPHIPGHLVEHLSRPRGAFTTLYAKNKGKLRGCVGYPTALLPLYRTVIETARAAAFDDPRFDPVVLAEVPDLLISISVLSPLLPIAAEAVEVGRHGLLISDGSRRGLLLPQVPVEHGWDRLVFLEQTCRKAGLPLDAWRNPQIRIEAFTAEVFADAGCEA